MPSRKYHVLFDDLLIEKRVICEDRKGATVHRFMDKGAKKWGAAHREWDPNHDAEMIRVWISDQVRRLGSIRQDTATDYVRIAWGHITLDYVVSREKDKIQKASGRRPQDKELDWNKLFKRAWRYYERNDFELTRYRSLNRPKILKRFDKIFGRGDKARP